MKPYVILSIVIFFVACGSSNKRSSVNYVADVHTTTETGTAEKIQQESLTGVTATRAVNTDYTERITTLFFDSTGNIISMQQTERDFRQSRNDSTRLEKSDTTLTEKNDSTNINIKDNSSMLLVENTKKDNRSVQGIEWLYVALGIGAVIAIILGVLWLVKKLKG